MEFIEVTGKPWGTYQVIYSSSSTNVKKIIIFPDQSISLQEHFHRREDWIIIEGKGLVQLDEKKFKVEVGDRIRIEKKQKHRITSIGKTPLCFIEVQTGEYFGEDDIVRYEDNYNRK